MGSQEATDLRKLADDIRKLLDEPITIAADQSVKEDQRWAGPNAERIRGELSARKTKLGTMADTIDQAAANRKDTGSGPNKPN
ncbi:hypothetical protein ACWGNF_04635 [Streptomyces sp. NPDC055808]|uniref:hypothetical protein n=1 Tax=Streptomyces sp. NPDC001828 TaxID=3364615 RepID=UPI0036A5A6F3